MSILIAGVAGLALAVAGVVVYGLNWDMTHRQDVLRGIDRRS